MDRSAGGRRPGAACTSATGAPIGLRPYEIYIDGQKVGHIKPGEAEAFEVPPASMNCGSKLIGG